MKHQTNNKNHEIQLVTEKVLNTLTKNTPQHNFAKAYLQAIPYRSALSFETKQLTQFIKDRFDYINSSIKNKINHRCYFPDDSKEKIDTAILEVVCNDARYLVESIESVLAKHKHHIKTMYHPIFLIEKNAKQEIKTIDKGSGNDKNLTSAIYIEFNNVSNKTKLETINKEIYACLLASQLSNEAHEKIEEKIDLIHKEVKKTPTPKNSFHKEWVDLINWLQDSNFSFFGFTEFTLDINKDNIKVSHVKNSGLGILDKSYLEIEPNKLLETLTTQVERLRDYRSPFLFDVIKVPSPIKISANLMRLSLKIPISKTQIKEYNFIGLLRRSSLHVKNTETPIIRLKIETFLKEQEILTGSYDYNQVIRYYTITPKYELFRTPTNLLTQITKDLLSTTNPNDVYVFNYGKIDPIRQLFMVVLPTAISSRSKIETIQKFFIDKVPHTDSEFVIMQGEKQTRIHLYFDQNKKENSSINELELEKELKKLIKPWESLLLEELLNTYSVSKGKSLYQKYVNAFPNHYRVMRTIKDTVRDIAYLEEVNKNNEIKFNLVPFKHPESVITNEASILIVYNKDKIDLTNIMPILQGLNIHVYDEVTTRIGPKDNVISYIHSFRVVNTNLKKIDETKHFPGLVAILEAIFKGYTVNDTLNGLVLLGNLHWREINILQTYRNYFLQLNNSYSKEKINATLLKYTDSTQLLVNYFNTKFSTKKELKTASFRLKNLLPQIKQAFYASLKQVEELTEDIILKQFFILMENTLRTNFFIKKKNNDHFISIKIDSKSMKVSHPTPYREIYVYDAEMEGCHLRFGAIARGGLRWSSRPFDFRKEVLGLVNTQQTKNVVIVPEGAKGGFITKNQTSDFAKNGQKQYQKFIMGLLDITDSLDKNSKAIHPESVIRYDKDDPYLVVAADKGTAQFSDFANEISKKYNFWLGDAFASGGSNGYNHKEVGITAKGAWECVKLHFLESGKDIEKEEFSVVGIGDMAGDVFGNGMLLSKNIQLKAAFNHIHIFIDPNPDSKKSYKERERLFNLDRSTWKDYNPKLISKGGGVFDRNAREIKLSLEIKEMLGIKKDVLNGEELIKAILKSKADLLWAGGIGTYIKADHETNLHVSDPANDSVRINHSECNFSIIGEGANLCVTEKARFELGKLGIRTNTDFIDNSAGVNMSDYEVNIKILLQKLLENKSIKTEKERNKLLEKATNEITDLVLKNNRAQHRLLSMDALKTKENPAPFQKLINHLEEKQAIQVQPDSIYHHSKLDECIEHNLAFPRPLLASLQSYVKMDIFSALNQVPLPDAKLMEEKYLNYFPNDFLKKFKPFILEHPLRKEILNTLITNDIVNQAGMTFFNDVQKASNRSLTEIAMLYIILNRGFGADQLKREILRQNLSFSKKYEALNQIEKYIKNEVLHILQLPIKLDFDRISSIQEMLSALKKILVKDNKVLNVSTKKWTSIGFTKKIAENISLLHYSENVSDLIFLNEKYKASVPTLLQLLFEVDLTFEFKSLKTNLQNITTYNPWELQQIETLNLTIRAQKLNLTSFILSNISNSEISKTNSSKLKHLFLKEFPTSTQYFSTLHELKSGQTNSLNTISVVINRLNLFTIHK